MLQKIIDFFRNLFGGFNKTRPERKYEDTQPAKENKPTSSNPPSTNSNPKEYGPAEDGSEITPDTIVNVVVETDPVIIAEAEVDEPIDITKDEQVPSTNNETTDAPTEVAKAQARHKARYLWCLDNGHGSKTAGKRSPKMSDGSQFLEYKFNRDIVERIMTTLNEKGVKVYNVVPEENVDNFLDGRVSRANKKKSDLPKLFVSVHSNAAPAPHGKWGKDSIRGVETWFFHNSKKGRKMASIFQKYLVEETGWKNRHIKSRPNKQFFVLRKTGMTAVLTENGFYNNKIEVKELMKDTVRQKIADAHVKAIMEIETKGL